MDAATGPAQQPAIETTISTVTVYSDQARVTRRGVVTLTGQERELILQNLPLSVQPESFRVKGTGTVAVKISGVHAERHHATEPVQERIAQLTQRLQALQDQKQHLKDQLEAIQLQREFVQNLSQKSVDRFSRGLAEQQVTLAQTGELMEFVGRHHTELATAIAEQNQQLRELEKQITALQNQLNEAKHPVTQKSYTLFIQILPSGAGDFTLEVSYTVNQAHWQPLYDLYVNTETNLLQLEYLAEVTQRTEEDWTQALLTLSTAKPGLGTLPPKLNPWYVNVLAPPPPAAAFQAPMAMASPRLAMAKSAPSDELEDLCYAADITADALAELSPAIGGLEAQSIAAEVQTKGGVVTFQVDAPHTVLSDGSGHKLTIFKQDYPCQLEYVAVPKTVSFAYLRSRIMNPATGATLLPGQANIFRDNEFVGSTQFENVSPGQEFFVNLGIDEGLQLQRELVERKVDKRFMQEKRLITYSYRLLINNLQNHAAKLILSEQLPVSRNEQIKVRLVRSTPQIPLGEMGLLEWTLELQPLAKQEISYQFTVEYPRQLQVIGLTE